VLWFEAKIRKEKRKEVCEDDKDTNGRSATAGRAQEQNMIILEEAI
jgi:hypothetical protein